MPSGLSCVKALSAVAASLLPAWPVESWALATAGAGTLTHAGPAMEGVGGACRPGASMIPHAAWGRGGAAPLVWGAAGRSEASALVLRAACLLALAPASCAVLRLEPLWPDGRAVLLLPSVALGAPRSDVYEHGCSREGSAGCGTGAWRGLLKGGVSRLLVDMDLQEDMGLYAAVATRQEGREQLCWLG